MLNENQICPYLGIGLMLSINRHSYFIKEKKGTSLTAHLFVHSALGSFNFVCLSQNTSSCSFQLENVLRLASIYRTMSVVILTMNRYATNLFHTQFALVHSTKQTKIVTIGLPVSKSSTCRKLNTTCGKLKIS